MNMAICFAFTIEPSAIMHMIIIIDRGYNLEVRQNARSFAANRKGVFIIITPSSSKRGWNNVLDCYECRDLIEDAFLEDKSEGDGCRLRSGNSAVDICLNHNPGLRPVYRNRRKIPTISGVSEHTRL